MNHRPRSWTAAEVEREMLVIFTYLGCAICGPT
jgi:hypothetical protein